MGSIKLKRRTLLKGIGGAALALPALEAMAPSRARASDAGPPCRFVVIYGGMSTAADNQPGLLVPDNAGPGYDLKRALLPLGAGALPSDPGLGGQGLDVQDHVSIVSGLKIPWDTGSGIPPGGKSPEFHYNSIGPQLSGMRGGPGRKEPPNGPTADQIVAEAIAAETTHRALSYRVQAASYVGTNSTGGSAARISYRDDGSGGLEAIDPVFSPELAYSTLFGNFVPPDPALAAAAEFRLRRRKSVVDLARGRTEELMPKLGVEDRQRMERHLDELRALETRLNAVPPAGGSCEMLPDPGSDPPVEGSAIEYQGAGGDGAGYSNEDLRADILFDLVNMSFACDLARVAAVRMTFTQCHMQAGPLVGGTTDDIHSHGHNGRVELYADCLGWHVKHFARLIAQLRDTPDVDGTPLLDHTAVILLLEGGQGFDPESGNGPLKAHSTENMIALVGGHAGGLNASGGQHIVATDAHPAQAVISAMNAVGVAEQSQTLGEITGGIPGLIG